MANETAATISGGTQSKMSIKAMLFSALISIVIGGGSGFALGYLTGSPETAAKNSTENDPTAPLESGTEKVSTEAKMHGADNANLGTSENKSEDHDPSNSLHLMTNLDPIITNLSDPSDIWIRLELALESETPIEPDISSQIHQDLFAYVRAMRLGEMVGPSAFIDLKAELLARARQRSENQVQKLYIKTLLYE